MFTIQVNHLLRFMWITLLISSFAFMALGCKESDEFSFIRGGDSEQNDPADDDLGASGITFKPTSHDFGPIQAYNGEEAVVITVTNNSEKSLYVKTFSGETDHYQVVAENCPDASLEFLPDASCQVTVRFTPQAPGLQSMTLAINYHQDLSGSELNETMGLTGTGVSPLSFDGIQAVDVVDHNTLNLSWNQLEEATSFIVFSIDGMGNLNYVKTVPNTGGSVQSTKVDKLQPSTSYTFRVRAIDALGNQESNTNDASAMTDANNGPALGAISNPNLFSGVTVGSIDANDVNPPDGDQDIDEDQLIYTCRYDNNINGVIAAGQDCDDLPNEGGGTASFNQFLGLMSGWTPRHIDVDVEFEFEIVAEDPYGSTSAVIFSGTVQAGTPSKPTVSGTNVVSPVNENNPVVYGETEPNFNVFLYSDSGCSTQIGTGVADGNGDFSVTATIPDDAITTVYANVENAIGNPSPCSTTSVTIIEDSSPPFIIMQGSSPVSPTSVTNPTIEGVTENGADVELFSNDTCTNSEATGTANGSGNFSLGVNVTAGVPVSFYARATDAAGNTSNCSASSIDYEAYAIADGVAVFYGTQTNAGSNAHNLNQGVASMQWSSGFYDFNYFAHSISTDSHQITVKQTGRYKASLTIPLTQTGVDSMRPAVKAEIYINGNTPAPGSIASSTYIRTSSGHMESSAHVNVLLSGLAANDTVEIKVSQATTDASTVEVTGQASMYLEHIPADEPVFSATGTRTTAGTNLASGTNALEWVSVEKDTGYTHDNASSSENITIDSAGDYIVYVNMPLYSTTQRANVELSVQVDGVPVSGALARQGYIRADTAHNEASVHWAGLVQGVNAGQVISITSTNRGGGGTVNVPAGKMGSLLIEKVDSSVDIFSGRGNNLVGGNEWNPGSPDPIRWTIQEAKDATAFSHDTGSNPHEVSVLKTGDYLLMYSDSLTSSVQRANPKMRVYVNGVAVSGAEVKTHYIRATSGRNFTSGSLVFFLQGLSANDTIEIRAEAEATAGTVADDADARLLLWRKPATP